MSPAPDTPFGHELAFIRLVAQQAQVFWIRRGCRPTTAKTCRRSPAPDENYLADQLRVVAQLISGGLQTPIYIVSIDGFDTHSEQVDGTFGNTEANHADLLRMVSQAIGAFQDDLKLLGVDDRVAGMTFSEFSRTIASNASLGTDHGAAAPLFVFGKNRMPHHRKQSADTERSSLRPTCRWCMISARYTPALCRTGRHTQPGKYSATAVSDPAHFQGSFLGHPLRHDIRPSKRRTTQCNNATTFTFTTDGGQVTISLIDLSGRVLQTIAEGSYPAGTHRVTFSRDDLKPGNYFYQVKVNGSTVTKNCW